MSVPMGIMEGPILPGTLTRQGIGGLLSQRPKGEGQGSIDARRGAGENSSPQ